MIITKVMRLSNLELGMLAHTYNLSNWEVETRGFGVQGHEKLHREFETSLWYIRSWLAERWWHMPLILTLRGLGRSKINVSNSEM